ncbi:unnamed protein product [Fusarium venenatum]|uniref:Uncharacterized protein n=1 Tax=Fusarium venenatum TaxID=56646 RepID=A0A2L2TIU1_9HYPO|nr:uncharacterized protein FVRRES_07382 [Fusarium venenatum]CEI62946.1 unnamed protein product [Fusarium venenatum]
MSIITSSRHRHRQRVSRSSGFSLYWSLASRSVCSLRFHLQSLFADAKVFKRLRRKFHEIHLSGLSSDSKTAGIERNIALIIRDCRLKRRILTEWRLD